MSNMETGEYPKEPLDAQEPTKQEDSSEASATAAGTKQDPPETVPTGDSDDVDSDPALSDGLGQDWSDEGGATPDGPATSSD